MAVHLERRYGSGVTSQPIWSRRIADELWSGVVTPLTFTMLVDLMAEHMVRRRLERAGLAALASRQVFHLERGYVYVDASLVADVMRELPSVFLSDGLLALLPPDLRVRVRRSERSLLAPSVASILLHLGWNERGWMPWSRGEVFRRAANRATRELAALPTPSGGPELCAAIDDVRAKLASYLEAVSWGMIYAYVFFHLTAQLLERWAPDTASIASLTMGLDGIWTFAIHEDLLGCAAVARHDPRLRAALEDDPDRVAARCLDGDLGDLGVRLRSLVGRHGHRLVGRDLSYPTWRERPGVVIEMLRKLLDANEPLTADERRARRECELHRAVERIGGGPAGLARRLVFERCFAWCQEYYVLRENMRYHADLFLSALRALALRAARLLVERGALHAHGDVFYLEASEMRCALSGTETDVSALATRVTTRRVAYDDYRRDPPPEVLVGRSEATDTRVDILDDRSRDGGLCGVGVSPGRAVGAARVVHSVEDLQALRAGEVIVAEATDPSWTSLLALGGALVLEMGGLLSHGAIVARELGIPAVVNVPHATRLLATGDRLVVDGAAGTVVRD